MSKFDENIYSDELTIHEEAYGLERLEEDPCDFEVESIESYSESEQQRILSASLGTDPAWCPRHDEFDEFVDYLGLLGEEDEYDEEDEHDDEEDYGQPSPSEYDEWQDYMGGDDWDHGQYDF